MLLSFTLCYSKGLKSRKIKNKKRKGFLYYQQTKRLIQVSIYIKQIIEVKVLKYIYFV